MPCKKYLSGSEKRKKNTLKGVNAAEKPFK
jgi:hypothetical protein